MMRIDVVLPLPLGPRKPKISPRPTRNDRSLTTCLSPKRLFRPCTSIAQDRTRRSLQRHRHRLPRMQPAAFSADGRASTMNTSLVRVSLL